MDSTNLTSFDATLPEMPQEARRPNGQARFRALFTFTQPSHTIIFVIGLCAAVLRGLAAPAAAFVTGRIFGEITAYHNGTLTGTELLGSVTQWSIILIIVGFGRLIVQGVFFASWAAYGELQARCARHKLYKNLILHEMKWFDTLEDGTTALLLRLNA